MTSILNRERRRRGAAARDNASTRRLTLLALGLLLLSTSGAAARYGPALEGCSRSGVMVTPSSNWREQIERARPGETIVMRGGTYSFTGTLQLPSGRSDGTILIKPYNCETVKLRPQAATFGTGEALKAGSYVTVAGIDIETASHGSFLNISSGRNIVLRNNRLVGARNDAFVIRGGEGITFEGNYINSGPAQRAAAAKTSGGHIFYLRSKGSARPRDVWIKKNQIEGSYFGNVASGDDVIAVAAGDRVMIENNLIANQYNIENILDIKTSNSSIRVVFSGNDVTGNFKGSKGGQDKRRPEACIVIGDTNPGARLRHLISGNRFDGCPAGFFGIGAGKRVGSAQILSNTFRDNTDDHVPGTIANAINTEIANNVFYGGALKIGSGGCNGQLPQGLVIRNNTFHGTRIYDQPYKCSSTSSLQSSNRLYR